MLENNLHLLKQQIVILECITDSMDICDAVVMQMDREMTLCM
ncbi:MAG: hypothetical protein ACLT33_14155 [Lachnospira pectinoschiza]